VPELHITVDTQIIMIGNGMSDLVRTPAHLQLMSHFHDAVFLALDASGQIRAEYERKMGAESEGRKWLANLAVHDRIRMHELASIRRKLKVELDKAHFHQSDRKFVRLAMATESKCLVAEESGYSKAVVKVLQKHAGLFVHSADTACEMIAATRRAEDQGSVKNPRS
jgi:hypothetical protein